MSSLSRGLEILEFVAANQAKGVTYPQILSYTGFPASSCFRRFLARLRASMHR